MSKAGTMTLPRQVRKQAEKADEAIKDLRKQAEGVQPAPEPQPVQPVEAPPAEPAPAPETPAPVQPTPPQEPQPADDTVEKRLERAEHRYKTLQGISDAQAREIRELRQKLEAPAPARPASAPESDKDRAKKHLKPQEAEQIGDQAIDTTARIARGEVEPEMAALREEINQANHRAFLAEFTYRHPEWEALNEEPEWRLWLGQVDPRMGVPRQQLLDQTVARRSVSQTWAWFEEFKRETGRSTAKPAQPTTVPAQRQPPAPKPAPSAAAPKAPPADPGKRKFSLSYVKKVMKDFALNQGRLPGYTPEEARNLMKEIEDAEREGRIDLNR